MIACICGKCPSCERYADGYFAGQAEERRAHEETRRVYDERIAALRHAVARIGRGLFRSGMIGGCGQLQGILDAISEVAATLAADDGLSRKAKGLDP